MDSPNIKPWYNYLQDIQWKMNLVIVSLLIIVDLIVLILVKFKVDTWGCITLVIHMTVSCLRLFTPKFVYDSDDPDDPDPPTEYFDELTDASQLLVWISIYYFVFEILLVKITIQNKDTLKMKRTIMFLKFTSICLMVMFSVFALIENHKLYT